MILHKNIFAYLVSSSKLDVAVAFHTSNRVKPKVFKQIYQPFLISLFTDEELNSGRLKVSLGYFTNNFKIVGNLDAYKNKADYTAGVNKLPKTARAAKANGGNAFKKISKKVFNKKFGDRKDATNVVLLITDDVSNVKPATFVEEAASLRETGAKIITVGLDKASSDELKVAATPGNKNVIMVNDYTDLSGETLIQNIRTALYIRKFKLMIIMIALTKIFLFN